MFANLIRYIFILTPVFFTTLLSAEVETESSDRYEGVAGCASSNCHGNVKTKTASSVNQNEYQIWFNHDAHSKAYKALLGADSKKIANHLGILKPEEDKLCLSCHATYIEEGNRGERFRLEDGVGCESCHGPSENYLKNHTLKGRSHADNISDGMTDLYDLNQRAKLCLDCHVGTKDKAVNHKLIGSGHPRLSFELDTYGILQPKHWSIDKDYTERKGGYEPYRAFLIGQVERSIRMFEMLSRELNSDNRMPELSNYYCYSCHHSLASEQWKTRTYGGSPGELRLNLSSLLVLSTAISSSDSSLANYINSASAQLAHETNKEDMIDEIKSIKDLINNEIMPYAKGLDIGPDLLKRVVKKLAEYSSANRFMPYEEAEQYAMGIFSCLSTLDPSGKVYKKEIKEVDKALKSEKEFVPENFSEAMSKLKKAF